MASINKVIAENLRLLDGREVTGRDEDGGNARSAGAEGPQRRRIDVPALR